MAMAIQDNPLELTDHFSAGELGVTGAEQRIVGVARVLASELLEPIRTRFGPVRVDDGYRPPAQNQKAGGKPNSFHLYQDGRGAADIYPLQENICDVFDWIRLESGLPFDKVILEFAPTGNPNIVMDGLAIEANAPVLPPISQILKEPDFLRLSVRCIHLQVDVNNAPRRLAFVGFTGAATVYRPVTVKGAARYDEET